MVYILNAASIVCFVISAIAAGMAAFLFFYLNIRNVWNIAADVGGHKRDGAIRGIVNMRRS